MPGWMIYALLGAVAAGVVSVLGKVGLKGVDSTVGTAVRSVVMAVFLCGIVAARGMWGGVGDLTARPLTFLVMSGLAGALSWLFMFKALSMAEVSKVAPLDKLSMPLGVLIAVLALGERPGWGNWAGIVMMVVGAFLASR